MMSPSNKLPPYVAELLAAERQAPRPSIQAERRVRARVAASVVATAGATALAASTAQAAAAAGVAIKTGGLGALGAKLTVVAFSVGVLSTAGVVTYRHHAAVEAKTTANRSGLVAKTSRGRRTTTVEPTPATTAPPPAPLAPTAPPAAPPIVMPVVSAPVVPATGSDRPRPPTVAPSAPPAHGDDESASTLAGESPLIEQARTRIAGGDPHGALALLAAHARRFAHGQLEEEREALWIHALVLQGHASEAQVRAREFERRFPNSIQRESVRTAVQSIR
jgi:hypothetical protein